MAAPYPFKHVAFIMDGNGRWAKAQGKPRLEGHRAGVKVLENILKEAPKLGVTHATFYAFSTENWKRPLAEVEGLLNLARWYFKEQLKKIVEHNIRLKFIGDHGANSQLPADILKIMQEAETATAACTGITAIIALNYGGRDELIRATNALIEQGKQVDEAAFETALETGDFPPVDVIIRTSGEQRLSNFLLWQAAYAEFMFTPTHWPAFTGEELAQILAAVAGRERRFGGLAQSA